jgi:hypothetical protein
LPHVYRNTSLRGDRPHTSIWCRIPSNLSPVVSLAFLVANTIKPVQPSSNHGEPWRGRYLFHAAFGNLAFKKIKLFSVQ